MKFKTTAVLGIVTVGVALGAYFLDYKKQLNQETEKEANAQIVSFNPEQINFFEIQKKNLKISLQKSEKGWTLLEPIQDQADNEKVEELIKALTAEKMSAVVKELPQLSNAYLQEYGLDDPAATYTFKNNAGSSHKVAVGSQKNFEGNSFIRVDSENRVMLAGTIWSNKADNELIYYREKRFYRHSLADISAIQIKSLQDHFTLKKKGANWVVDGADMDLDQNKVRDMLKKISEASIIEYVFDGEPSATMLKEKGLIKSPVHLQLISPAGSWSAEINQNEKEKAVFALTDRPTNLVRLNISEWEFFGNLNLDSLRDRINLTRFNLDEVKKIYYKANNKVMNFEKEGDQWKSVLPVGEDKLFEEKMVQKTLNHLHDLEITEFIDKNAEAFRGTNMIILKADSDRLVFQLNWGPELKMKRHGVEKDYFYARTQLDPLIFALEKNKIDSFGFNQIITDKKAENSETGHADGLPSADEVKQ